MAAQVLTQHNNSLRTGVNQAEPALTRGVVRSSFRKLHELLVDPPAEGGPTVWASQVVAQPLVAQNVRLPDGTTKDILVVCTMHGTVYAFDAGHDCARIWAVWLGPPILDLTDANGNIHDDKDLHRTTPEWGILSTPVVDAAHGRVFVVMWHNENSGTYRLHSLDLATGHPVQQAVTITGSAADTHGHPVPFDPLIQKQRPGLLTSVWRATTLGKASSNSPRATCGS